MNNNCKKWEILKKYVLLKDLYIKVERRIYYNPASKKSDKVLDYSIVNFAVGGTVVIVALIPKDGGKHYDVILLRQYRPAADRCIVNLPGGRVEKDQCPEEVILEELKKETRTYSAPKLSLNRIYETFQNPTRITDKTIIFFTKEACEMKEKKIQEEDETAEEGRKLIVEDFNEVIKFLSCEPANVKELDKEKDIFDMTTVAGLFLAYSRLNSYNQQILEQREN